MIKPTPEEFQQISKEELLRIIKEYLNQTRGICQKENLDKEDFESPGWALKQAHINGMIKMINKLENFIPIKELT